jgi:hydrogenase expression/formation protein HypC
MCLAIPMELVRIDEKYGYVEHGGKEYPVDLALITDPQIGDWLLAHGELAVNRVSAKDAQEIIALIAKSEHSHA